MSATTEIERSRLSETRCGPEQFFALARERYEIKLRRAAGMGRPWTTDPVLHEYRFCNVHREDDWTTRWFRVNIRDQLSHFSTNPSGVQNGTQEAVIGVAGFRWFNRIETAVPLVPMLRNGYWVSDEVRDRLSGTSPLVTGAYMIKTPTGKSKLEGIIWCMEKMIELEIPRRAAQQDTLEGAWRELTASPFLGGFMAYEIVSDLRWCRRWALAPDIMTWANPGPGAARGLGWVIHGDPTIYDRNDEHDRAEMIGRMRWLLYSSQDQRLWPQGWPAWEMREVEHWLCEYDKWCRATYNGQRLKRRYE